MSTKRSSTHVAELRRQGRKVVLASYSNGARERLKGLLADHGLTRRAEAESWQEALGAAAKGSRARRSSRSITASPRADVALLTEQDMLGDRLVRRAQAQARAPTPSSPSWRRSPPATSSSTPITASAATRG